MVFERNINTRRNGRREKTTSRETTNAALTHGARDKEKHIPTRMPVCDRVVIGQQLSTISQQFFSFFFLFRRDGGLALIYTLALGGVGNAVALYKQETVTEVLAGGGVGRVRLVGPVGRGSAYNLQLGYRFAIGDAADAGGVNGYITTEETTVSTDRGA